MNPAHCGSWRWSNVILSNLDQTDASQLYLIRQQFIINDLHRLLDKLLAMNYLLIARVVDLFNSTIYHK